MIYEIPLKEIKEKHIEKLKEKILYYEKKIKPYQKRMEKGNFSDKNINEGARIEQIIDDLKISLNHIEEMKSREQKKRKYANFWVTHILDKHGIINKLKWKRN